MSKIKTGDYNDCLEELCPFRRECAQHTTAGDFRSEDGFRPELQRINGDIYCDTLDSNISYTEFGKFPVNFEDLHYGMVNLKNISESVTFEI